MKQRRHVLVISGGKGGTGKSTVAISAVAWALLRGMTLSIYDGDAENTDVLKPAERRGVHCAAVDLHVADGWLAVADGLEQRVADLTIVNTPGGITGCSLQHEHMLRAVAQEMGVNLSMVFVLNRQRDSVEILKRLLDGLDDAYGADSGISARWTVRAVRNLYWGEAPKFVRFNGSAQSKRVDSIFDFPDLHDLVADKVIDSRLLFDDFDAKYGDGRNVFSIAERSILRNYNFMTSKIFDEMFGGGDNG